MKLYYKFSEKGKQPRLFTKRVSKKDCFKSFINSFGEYNVKVLIDNSSKDWVEWFGEFNVEVIETNLGNSLANNFLYNLALRECSDDEIVYFSEDDYLYLDGAKKYIEEGLSISDYVTLYDHPDKYMNQSPNPLVIEGAEESKVFKTESSHWKLTNSTTMTFGTKIKILKEDIHIIQSYNIDNKLPDDFKMFIELRNRGRKLVSPIPTRSTHLDGINISSFVNWENLVDRIL